ncbi:MAG: zinc-binding dehydrogenase [Leucobacter sp.]|nr:zinc-binding dehydrogenase [Leucobacter sp.]
MSSMMRAVVQDRFGAPDVLKLTTVPVPVPAQGEALVRVRACGLNSHDLLVRSGEYPATEAFPHILGGDIAGEVAAFGDGCRRGFSKGDRVVLYWQRACGICESCRRGKRTTCLRYRYLGTQINGGYAEYVVVPEENLVALGEFDDWTSAAAFPMSFGTAWRALFTRGEMKASDTVLIQGASTGVGLAAVQIAKLAGARVIATAGSEKKLEVISRLGADVVINYAKTDLRSEILKITGKRGVDLVLDAVGGELWAEVIGSLTRHGRVVICGAAAGPNLAMHAYQVFEKELSVLGSNSAALNELESAVERLKTGELSPVVDQVLSLEDAAHGHELLEKRAQFGKLVLDLAL